MGLWNRTTRCNVVLALYFCFVFVFTDFLSGLCATTFLKLVSAIFELYSKKLFEVIMGDRNEKNGMWLSVPQFGDWDQKGQAPDYSLDFAKIREMRKQNKRDLPRASLENERAYEHDHVK